MPNQRNFRIILIIACFIFAGVNGYQIIQGNYTMVDVFLMITFLLWGSLYIYLLTRDKGKQQ